MIPEEFIPDLDQLQDCGERLYPAWIDYVRHVSPDYMAMSLNSCRYILWLAEKIKPASAVDFGSGFTSYVLRLACDDVCTVDDSKEWLDKTKRFLKRYRIDNSGLFLLDEYQQIERSHDLVVYDFSSGEIRDAHFGFAISQITPGGVGIMDDAMHPQHWVSMFNACRTQGRILDDLRICTTDKYHRYAALVT